MSQDLFQFQQSEIFQRSQCLAYEDAVNSALYHELEHNGYRAQDQYRRVWHGPRYTVIVCFVDDIGIVHQRHDHSIADWFNPDTVVITDNVITVPVRYQLKMIPDWYRGIYSYTPQHLDWTPERNFHLSINRASCERIDLLVQLIDRHGFQELTENNHINFNAYDPYRANQTEQDYRDNFAALMHYHAIDPPRSFTADTLAQQIPLRTHNFTPEQASLRCWLNVVIETYVSKDVVSVSEKTFRAVVTPQPWIVQGSRDLVSYLESVGFDTLGDVVGIYPSDLGTQDMVRLIDDSMHRVRSKNLEWLRARCAEAARYNRHLLRKLNLEFRHQWRQWVAEVVRPPAVTQPIWHTTQ